MVYSNTSSVYSDSKERVYDYQIVPQCLLAGRLRCRTQGNSRSKFEFGQSVFSQGKSWRVYCADIRVCFELLSYGFDRKSCMVFLIVMNTYCTSNTGFRLVHGISKMYHGVFCKF